MKGGRLGFLERLVFTFMGPPEVGDVNAPADLPPRPARVCPRCSRPYDEHEVVRDTRLTWSRCPTPPEP